MGQVLRLEAEVIDAWMALRLLKWLGLLLYGAGLWGALVPADGALRAQAARYPATAGFVLLWFAGWGLAVAEAWLDGPREIAVVGEPDDPRTAELVDVARRSTAPGAVVVCGAPGSPAPLLRDRPLVGATPAAYVCRRFVCDAPTTDPDALARSLPLADRLP